MDEVELSVDNPKTLVDICLECLVLNNVYINGDESAAFHNLPTTIRELILDKKLELESRVIDDENYSKILDHRTREVFMKKNTCKVRNLTGFLIHLQEHCQNVVKINLSMSCFPFEYNYDMTIFGDTLGTMVHLEHIDLEKLFYLTDHCLECIGLNCHKLKYLNLNRCGKITDYGIRALCDPSLAPYGNCSQLTHVYLDWCYDDELLADGVSISGMSLLLIHCPNLEALLVDQNVFGVVQAILKLSGVNSSDLKTNDYEADDPLQLHILEALDLGSLLEQRTFKLKSLNLCSFEGSSRVLSAPVSQAIGRFCPLLENLEMTLPVPNTFSLCGFHHLPLKSITINGKAWKYDNIPQPMGIEIVQLLQSVGSSLITLTLNDQAIFDLRVISRECPNLLCLSLYDCDTLNESAMWPNYPVNELNSTTFNSLVNLTLRRNIISNENIVALLLSPNLEVLDFGERYKLDEGDNAEGPHYVSCSSLIQQVLHECPDAFSKVREVCFKGMRFDKQFLSDFLDRAVVLESLMVEDCFSNRDGRRIYFELEFVKRMIPNSNVVLSVY